MPDISNYDYKENPSWALQDRRTDNSKNLPAKKLPDIEIYFYYEGSVNRMTRTRVIDRRVEGRGDANTLTFTLSAVKVMDLFEENSEYWRLREIAEDLEYYYEDR